MDIVGILALLKDKVLDLKDIELLKSAYSLQEENITQLKTSNDIFRENAAFQKEAIRRLETEVATLRGMVAAFEDLAALQNAPKAELVENAHDCLTLLESWLSSLTSMKEIHRAYRFADIDELLGLRPGMTKCHLQEGCQKKNFIISNSGPETFILSLRSTAPRFINRR